MEYIFTRNYKTMHTHVWITILKEVLGKPRPKFGDRIAGRAIYSIIFREHLKSCFKKMEVIWPRMFYRTLFSLLRR